MATAEVKIDRGEFTNEPFTDFSKPENRSAMLAALAKVKSDLGKEYPQIIGSERIITPEKTKSTNPSHPEEVVGVFQQATVEMANRAVEVANAAFASWNRTPAGERVEVLFRTVDLLRRHKFELAALMCYEVGKNWAEADADIAETIDFCEFYGREMLRLAGPQP